MDHLSITDKTLCECGCGGVAPIARDNDKHRGYVKGQPCRFITGHWSKLRIFRGDQHPSWNGGRTIRGGGYISVLLPTHPRANGKGYVLEHILIAERALGRPLPAEVVVHHVNEIEGDNRNGNLVICEDQAYHQLIHRRTRAFRATGSVLGVKCRHCKRWGLPGDDDLYTTIRKNNTVGHSYHRQCHAKAEAMRFVTQEG